MYTGRGVGSSCYCISLGTSFIYSTAPLLTSCPHTESHHQAHVFPCLHRWNLFLPLGLRNTLKTQQLKRSPLPQVCSPFSYILSPALLLTTLAFVLQGQSSDFILHVHSHFLHPSPSSLHQWWEQAIYLDLIQIFMLPPPHKHLPLP